MTEAIALQLIVAVSTFCTTFYNQELKKVSETRMEQETPRACYQKIWTCGHKTTDATAISVETHNCIGKYLRGELK